MKKCISGFTLVELIVVVTIIAILGTVGFVSYSNYLTGARDANRTSQMVRISEALQTHGTTNNLPLPENGSDITVGSTIIGYQGDIGETVLQTISYSTSARDPRDNSPFIYYLGTDRRNFQLMAFMEEQKALTSFFPQSTANISNRFPKSYGRKMGILLENNTNNPLHRVAGANSDLAVTTGFTAYLSDNETIEGVTEGDLLAASSIANCKRRRESFGVSTNGIYAINPNGSEIDVYCEMSEQGGGWTLVARSVNGGSGSFTVGSDIGTLTDLGGVYNLDAADIDFSQLMLASYQNSRNINTFKTTSTASVIYTVDGHTLNQGGITGGSSGDGYNGEQGMIFVR
ncbi:prepilin-type N-terminal cleavage/methylation domain-containing protein [Candidatus Gracilibacteria bacterium]|nr:prepilin-type N-terminal cleavage/methylation domain-containing protein [Candidatus Gracilibacteria bacterium]